MTHRFDFHPVSYLRRAASVEEYDAAGGEVLLDNDVPTFTNFFVNKFMIGKKNPEGKKVILADFLCLPSSASLKSVHPAPDLASHLQNPTYQHLHLQSVEDHVASTPQVYPLKLH